MILLVCVRFCVWLVGRGNIIICWIVLYIGFLDLGFFEIVMFINEIVKKKSYYDYMYFKSYG